MSTHLKQKEEKILEIVEKLNDESAKGKPIVVEGKKDQETLRGLGAKGPIVSIKTGGKSFVNVISEIEVSKTPEVILLLDFDRRGREATKHFKRNLETAKIKPNTKFWYDLTSLVGKDIQCVESLITYLETLKKKLA